MDGATRGTSRLTDFALLIRRGKTKEPLLAAGGVWDNLDHRFVPGLKPRQVKVIDFEESQVEWARWWATWMEAVRLGLPRDISLALAAGARRGGKTFALVVCAIAFLIDTPEFDGSPTIGWVVSTRYKDRDEIDAIMEEQIPQDWWKYRGQPEFRYRLISGAALHNVSSDDPEALRRGRVDIAVFNEAQKMPLRALINGIYGTADKGGIAVLAANPPRRHVGAWVGKLRQAINYNKIKAAKYFSWDARGNTKIDQPARRRVTEIVSYLDADAAKADSEDLWIPIGARAYPAFTPATLGPPPELGDVTGEVLRNKIGMAYPFVGGVDFQLNPGNALAVVCCYGDRRAPIYQVVAELLRVGVEDDFLDDLWNYGGDGRFRQETLKLIGDSSGAYKTDNPMERISGEGRRSFEIFRARRWSIDPVQEKRSDRGEYSKNPDVHDRVNLVNRLLSTGRLRIDESRCPLLTKALEECETDAKGKPKGYYSHITDALGYALWWLEPEPVLYDAGPLVEGVEFVNRPPGPRLL